MTPTATRRRRSPKPLVDGGQFAPLSSGNAAGSVFINAKWQFNANAMYQAAYGIEVAANVFGRQGYPFPLFRTQALGADTGLQVLVTPQIDTFRYDNVWNTDLRVGADVQAPRREPAAHRRPVQRDEREHRAHPEQQHPGGPGRFNQIAQNLSPRIFRVGLVVGF